MDLTAMTLDAFLVTHNRQIASSSPTAFEAIGDLSDRVGPLRRTLTGPYTLHEDVLNPGNVLLVAGGEVVGFYLDDFVALRSDHRGKGLGTAMILYAVPHRQAPDKRIVSLEGLAALERAWRVANGKATSPWWP